MQSTPVVKPLALLKLAQPRLTRLYFTGDGHE